MVHAALFYNSLDSIIEDTLAKYDSAFNPIRQGSLPSTSPSPRSNIGAKDLGYLADLDGPDSVGAIQHMDHVLATKK